MKKAYLTILPGLLTLAACGAQTTASSQTQQSLSADSNAASSIDAPEVSSSVEELAESSEEATPVANLKVACPSGAPAVAFYQHIKDSEEALEINSNASNVVGYLSENSGKDIVVAPTNAGLNAIVKKSAPYKIAATLTFGNFYVAATGHDGDGTMNADDYVVLFQQNNVPDKLFNYVYGSLGLTNVHYVNAASDAAKVLISGVDSSNDNAAADYVLLAEPALTTALSKNANASQYADLQAEFANKSNGLKVTQASVFVSNSADKASVDAYLSGIEAAVSEFLATPAILDTYLEGVEAEVVSSKFSASAAVLKTMASNNNRMGLGYAKAKDNKGAIENFMKIFGMEEIGAEVYY